LVEQQLLGVGHVVLAHSGGHILKVVVEQAAIPRVEFSLK
jgi:hypothetical protein